jgi:hypothetical protein
VKAGGNAGLHGIWRREAAFMYETKSEPLLEHPQFIARAVRHFAFAVALLLTTLALGMWGYWYFEHLSPLDGFLNAAMLLGGMGPVNMPITPGGKGFAGCYALFAGLVLLTAANISLAPWVHRLLHKFHFETED